MDNKNDWKKLEKEQKIKDSSIIQKYGFDIKKYTEKTFSKDGLEKRKKRNKLIKILIVLIILLTIFIQINSVNMKIKTSVREKLTNDIEKYYNEEVEIISEKTYWRGNGFYTLKTKNTPNIEMHVVIDGENTSNDLDDRYYKYYFEKWQNENKNKFVVNESYEDYTYKTKTMPNWQLNYYTYIEVSNYEQMLQATEDIISFIEYTGNRTIIIGSYIKINDNLIIPHGTPNETNEEIRESAKWQYDRLLGN